MAVRRVIREFRGTWLFLSNFYPWEGSREMDELAPVRYSRWEFPSSEHAYQAAKFIDTHDDRLVEMFAMGGVLTKFSQGKNPAACAKIWTRKAIGWDRGAAREWDEKKDEVMYEVVLAKFSQNALVRSRLLGTGSAYLEEGNWWKDRYWGVSPVRSGRGMNKLGWILMRVREELGGSKCPATMASAAS